MQYCQYLLIFTLSMAVYHIEMNQMIDAKFRFSNFNVLCFVTLGYAFLLKSDLLPLHGKSTIDVLRQIWRFLLFCIFVVFIGLFSITICSNSVLSGSQLLSVVVRYFWLMLSSFFCGIVIFPWIFCCQHNTYIPWYYETLKSGFFQ